MSIEDPQRDPPGWSMVRVIALVALLQLIWFLVLVTTVPSVWAVFRR